MDDNDFAAMFADATPAYVRLSAKDTTALLDSAVYDGSGAVDRTLRMHDVCVLRAENKPEIQTAAALDLSSARTLAVENEPFRIENAPAEWRAHAYTAPLTPQDVSRSMKTALLAPLGDDALYAIGSAVGFPGRAQNGDVPHDELPIDTSPDAPKFDSEALRDAAVLWDANGVPRWALVRNVAITANKLDAYLASIENAPPATDDAAALDALLACCSTTRAAISRVFARLEQGPPSAGELKKLPSTEQTAWHALPKEACTRDTLVFTLAHYTLWPQKGPAVVKNEAIVNLVKGTDNPMCVPIVASKNRGKLRGKVKIATPDGKSFNTLLTEFAVPIVPQSLFEKLKSKKPAKKAAAAAAAVPPSPKKTQTKAPSPKKAPVAADVGKLTTAATDDAIGAALAQQAAFAEAAVPEGVDEDPSGAAPEKKSKPKRKADDDNDDAPPQQTPKKAKKAVKARADDEEKQKDDAQAASPPPPKKKKATKKAPTTATADDECAALRAEIIGDVQRARNCHRVHEMFEKFGQMVASGKLSKVRCFSRVAEHDLDEKPVPADVSKTVSHFAQLAHYLNLQEPIGRALRAAHGVAPPPEPAAEENGASDAVDLFD